MIPDVLLITDPGAPRGAVAPVVDALGAVGDRDRGRVWVQLRAKSASARDLVTLGRALLPAVRAAGGKLVVNGRVDVARAIGADGAHLPERGLAARDVRALLGPTAIVGRSCHDAEGLRRAARERVTYAVLGPIRAVPGKGSPLGLDGFGQLARGREVPILALGGITADDVAVLRAHGAAGVAVIRAIGHAEDPGAALRLFLTAIAREGQV